MRRTSFTIAILAALLAAPPAAQAETDPYCAWVTSRAEADAAVLVAPELIGSAGLVNAGTSITGDANVAFDAGVRLTFGLRYDFMQLYRGLATLRAGDADCRRHVAQRALEAFLEAGRSAGAGEAAAAQLEVLEELLPRAEERLRRVRDEVEAGRAGIEEPHATQLRVADLRNRAADARLAAERYDAGGAGERSLAELRRAYLEADAALEAAEADVREATAWEVGIRGGYDQVIGLERELPVFAVLSVGWSFGQPFQQAALRRAAEARGAWIGAAEDGVLGRAQALQNELETLRRIERQRLDEAKVLLADVESRLEAVEGLKSSRLRRLADSLFFEWARLRVEEAGLRARLRALDELLGS